MKGLNCPLWCRPIISHKAILTRTTSLATYDRNVEKCFIQFVFRWMAERWAGTPECSKRSYKQPVEILFWKYCQATTKLICQDRCVRWRISCNIDGAVIYHRKCYNYNKWSFFFVAKNTFVQVFFKCHYDYDPANDNLIPCKEAGLRFETGDILQIVNQDDVNWWQVRWKSSICSPLCDVSRKQKCILNWKRKQRFECVFCPFVLHRLVMLRVVAQDWSRVRCWRRRGKHL